MASPKSLPSETPSRGAATSSIGNVVRALRTQAGLTLREVAERGDLSTSTISKVESGQLSPGYDTLLSLSIGLGVDVAELFRPNVRNSSTGRRGITRKGTGAKLETPRYIYEALAADVSNKEFLPLLTVIKPGAKVQSSDLTAHEGEEFIYVIKGEATLHTELYEPLVLASGDSVYFDSRSRHVLTGSDEGETLVLWVCSHRDALRLVKEHSLDSQGAAPPPG
ncbi:XRE family transcriptional regulator [Sphingomonas sp. BT-65]|uniref:helix-turn-helix domain-containing protein n=1 Tax=Sphingomonas sp. BT-65 TaxID=2989821 RepID=UPI0022360F26|nr:XRE family transcriptional regulator [Sphingomonas sp. BT-65]MCW4460894.1 XRE family transcriptional regulator [Sphingomonas sp. BT-65]